MTARTSQWIIIYYESLHNQIQVLVFLCIHEVDVNITVCINSVCVGGCLGHADVSIVCVGASVKH